MSGIGHIEIPLLVGADAQRPDKFPLGGAPPGLEKCSIGEKDMDVPSLRVSDIDGAAGVHRDPRRTAHTRVLKGKQGGAFGFKFVDKAPARVGEENVAERIGREGHRRVEFARALAFFSPSAEEFKRWRGLRLRRGIHAISAGNEEEHRSKRGLSKSPSQRIGIHLRHAAKVRPVVV